MQLAGQVNDALRRVPRWLVYTLLALPLAALVWRAALGDLGVDPVETLEHRLGEVGLQLLVAGLLVTPLRRLLGVNLLRFRRAIGVMAFVYIALHLSVWVLLDLQMRWAEIGADLVKRPYIIVGMVGLLAMIPLAVTSNDASVRRLGAARWARLHRLTYLAAAAGAVHYLLLVKAWPPEPIVYGALVALLLGLRLYWHRARVAARAS